MSEARETRILMISPDSMLTPDQLVREVHAMCRELNVKETCYGCLIEGSREKVGEVLSKVRGLHRFEVFSKVRAYPCGDPRRCRAQHGTRPGFSQLEAEWAALPVIQHSLMYVESGGKAVSPPDRERVPVDAFKKICEAFQ